MKKITFIILTVVLFITSIPVDPSTAYASIQQSSVKPLKKHPKKSGKWDGIVDKPNIKTPPIKHRQPNEYVIDERPAYTDANRSEGSVPDPSQETTTEALKQSPGIMSPLTTQVSAPIEEAVNNASINISSAPYNIDTFGEQVSTLDGSLTIERTDMVLPGRNGMGFELKRTYNSTSAQLHEMDINTTTGANRVTTPYDFKQFPLGVGWRFNISSIETKTIGTKQMKYLHLEDGGVYEIDANLKLIGYPWKDLVLSTNTSISSQGKTSAYVLENVVTGIKQYFSADGKLIDMRDLSNNKIQFKYIQQGNYGEVLTNIYDDAGNAITITYLPDKVVIELNYGTAETVTLLKYSSIDAYHNRNVEYLYSETDPAGRKTGYYYSVKNANFNLNGTNPSLNNSYGLISEVWHPSQAKTLYVYDYSPTTRYISQNAVNQVYRLKQRWDAPINGTAEDAGQVKLQTINYVGDMAASYGSNTTFQTQLVNQVDDKQVTTVYDMEREHISVDPKLDTPVRYYSTKVTTKLPNENFITEYTPLKEKRADLPKSTVSYTEKSGVKSAENRQSIVYDDFGQLDKTYERIESSGTTALTDYTYDSRNLLTQISEDIDVNKKRITNYTYNTQKELLSETVSEQNLSGTTVLSEVNYTLDNYGNPILKTITSDGGKIFVDYEYDTRFNAFLTKQTNDMMDPNFTRSEVIRETTYDTATGLLKSIKDGNGNTTSYEYDKIGRVTKITNPDGTTQTALYQDDVNQIVYTDETKVKTTQNFNVYGWPRQNYLDNERNKTEQFYDINGRVVEQVDAAGSTLYAYDEASRLKHITNPSLESTLISYDSIANTQTVTTPDGGNYKETYGLYGEVLRSEEIWNGNPKLPTKYTYDYEGRVRNTLEHYAFKSDAYNLTTNEYDALGQLISVTNPKNEKTSYSYTRLGQLKQVKYPDRNYIEKVYDQSGNLLIETDANKKKSMHWYDKEGNQNKLQDRAGNTFTYEFDNRDRLKKKTATNIVSGTNDPNVSFTYDTAGRRKSMTDVTGTTMLNYDTATGSLTSIKYPDEKQTSYAYDNAGQVTQVTDPFGKTTKYAYENGYVTKAGEDLINPDAAFTYKLSRPEKASYNGGKFSSNLTYKESNLTGITQTTADGQALNSYGYEYDHYGNITKLIENNAVISNLTYDSMHRVQTNSMFNETYNYNNRGNRQTLQSDQLPAIPQNQYKYDSRDQLTEVTTPSSEKVSYVYNGDGLMVNRIQSDPQTGAEQKNSKYYYDADANIIAEETTEGQTTKQYSYIRSGSSLIAKVDPSGEKQYFLHNGHGDVVSVTDAQGNKLVDYKYDIWGELLSKSGPNASSDDNAFQYSGEYYDETTGLQYLRARWYDPSIGRFIQEDTYEGELDNPLNLNLYTYVENNPLKYVDPSGNVLDTILDIGSAVWSLGQLIINPSWENAGYLAWDMGAAVVPFVPGSYVAKGAKTISKINDIVKTPTPKVKPKSTPTPTVSKPKSKIANNTQASTKAKNVGKGTGKGIVYKRTNVKTGDEYIGQAKSMERYGKRQAEHSRANKNARYEFEEVGRAKPGKALNVLEQKKINEYGGLKKNGGTLENKRNQISEKKWKQNGILPVNKKK